MASMKFEPSLYGPDMTYGDWDKIFLNDLVIMKKDKAWYLLTTPG